MKEQYNVLIVGAGNIAAFFDTPMSESIFTHAHAFCEVESFNLLGFVDVSEKKGLEAAKLWKTNYFSTIEEAFRNKDIDIVSICVPDEYHYEVLKKISNYPIKLVFAEKPLAKNINQAKEIISIYEQKNIRCLVNYSRRFVGEFDILKNKILKGEYGEFICGNGYYGKGIVHNGSHLIDLLRHLIGEIIDFKIINYNFDFYDDDPSVSASLNFENNKNFIIQHMPCDKYTIFELDLLFEHKRIKIVNSGFKIKEYNVQESNVFKGYKNLFKEREYGTELNKAMFNAVVNIYNNLTYNENLKCNLEDGCKVMEICDRLKANLNI